MKWEQQIEQILNAQGIDPAMQMPNGQSAAEFLEGAVMGAMDEIDEQADSVGK